MTMDIKAKLHVLTRVVWAFSICIERVTLGAATSQSVSLLHSHIDITVIIQAKCTTWSHLRVYVYVC